MTCFWSSGAPAATDRCLDLREALAAAEGDEPHGSLVLDRAAQALSRGQAEHARELMGRAESIGPSGYFRYFPWFEDGLQRWRLYLALVADRSLTEAQLSDAAATARSWEFRRAVAGLRRELWGEPIPEPPTIDPASVKIPLEDEIRAFIAKLESER